MDASTLPYALDLVAGSGVCLSPEKRAALRTSLQLVQRDYRFEQVRLWGRIQGTRGAYYVSEGLGPDRSGARSRLYRCCRPERMQPGRHQAGGVLAWGRRT